MQTDLLRHARLQFLQGRMEDLLHQRGLTTAADATDHAKYLQRNLHIQVAQVMLPGAFHQDGFLPGPRFGRRPDLEISAQIFSREAAFIGDDGLIISFSHHFAALMTGQWPHINDVIGFPHHLFIVLNDHHRVVKVPEMLQHTDQTVRIARVQANGWLIEDIQGVRQIAAQTACELYPLAFPATQAVGQPVEGEIAQPHVEQGGQPLSDLQEDPAGDLFFVIRQGKTSEPLVQIAYLHGAKFADMGAADLHIQCLRTKPVATAGMTGGASPIPG